VLKRPIGTGAVICLYNKTNSLDKNVIAVPAWDI